MNILTIDDEEKIRITLKRVLEKEGHTVLGASEVKDAMDKQVTETYDLIIMDLKMPKINGKEIIDLIRLRYPDLPIFILSGYIESKEALIELGATKVFDKPVDMDVLIQAVSELENAK